MFVNEKLQRFRESIKNKRVAVLGIGVSNIPLIRMLLSMGAHVTACDKKGSAEIGWIADELMWLGAELVLGNGYLDNLDHDIIFKTPGMRFDIPELCEARKRGSVVTSEMEVFFDLCPAPIIGVTGSDGKTTTTTLIYEILKKSGYTCHLGGNIGKPLLADIESIMPDHLVVLELSSFQLHTMQKSPHIAVVTNITPNHLDMHKSMQEYIDAKKNIFLFQGKGDTLVINHDNEITRSFYPQAKGEAVFFSRKNKLESGVYLDGDKIMVSNSNKAEPVLNVQDILLPGVHNIENYMAAIGATYGLAKNDAVYEVAKSFKGVEHRIEFVREINGVRFYNSSIDSSPTRSEAALRSFKQKLIVIAGGYDKKIPFDSYGSVLCEKAKLLILIGDTADKIEKAVKSAPEYDEAKLPILRVQSMDEAVNMAFRAAKPQDTVILSPACASFDMYKNFEERGNHFKTLVNSLAALKADDSGE